MAQGSRRSILVISPGFPPTSIGGTEQHVRTLVNALAQQHDIRVLCRDAKGTQEERDGIVLRCPGGSKTGLVDELVDPNDEAFEDTVSREVRDLKPDVVHIHHWIHLSHSLISLCGRLKVPVVATIHDHYPLCARTDLRYRGESICSGPEDGGACATCFPPPRAVFVGESFPHRVARVSASRLGGRRAVERWIQARAQQVFHARLYRMRAELEAAAAVICPSVALKRALTAVWRDLEPRLTLLRHGVDTTWAHRVRRAPSHRVRFAFVGLVAPQKGVELLLEAFGRLHPATAELAVYGGWGWPNLDFQQRVTTTAAQVGATMHGLYEQADLSSIYSAVDVAVIPSTCRENAPLVVLEAFAGGAPVVASDVGGLPELVNDGHDGLLFRVGDVDDLTAKLELLANDPDTLMRLRPQVKPPKSIDTYASEIGDIYERALARLPS
jgi:glycosyltransferase involved in cell wall biosynthesis